MTLVIPRRAYSVEWSDGAAGPLLHDDGPAWDEREPSWQDFALCAEVGNDLWFPEKGGSVREPKAVCRRCEVRAQCLEYALENDERLGIWGGLSERERRRVKREAARPAAEIVAEADERAGRQKSLAVLKNERRLAAERARRQELAA